MLHACQLSLRAHTAENLLEGGIEGVPLFLWEGQLCGGGGGLGGGLG